MEENGDGLHIYSGGIYLFIQPSPFLFHLKGGEKALSTSHIYAKLQRRRVHGISNALPFLCYLK